MKTVWARQTDIAEEAGVSLATVDRVLNKRPGVSIHTANRIWAAIESLQEGGERSIHGNVKPLQLDVVLPAGPNSFLNLLAEEIEKQGDRLLDQSVTVTCHRIESFAPQILAHCITDLGNTSDGLAIMALENPLVREAVSTLRDKGIPTVSLVSNLSTPKTLGYVGINNRAAGRTAAYITNLINKQEQGEVALFEGSIDLAYSDHQEREFGFSDALREYAPHLKILGKWATQDNHEEAYRLTRKILEEHPHIIGIYCIGGGIRGIARALQDMGREKEIICIGHDLTPHTREFLLNGTLDVIINQSPVAEAREALKMLIDFKRKGKIEQSQIHIPTDIFFRENLP